MHRLKLQRVSRLLWVGILIFGCYITPNAFADENPEVFQTELTVNTLSPEMLQAGSTLQITGSIRNLSQTTLADIQLQLRIQDRRLGTREEVNRWLDGLDGREGWPLREVVQLPGLLAPGQSAAFVIRASAAALQLPRPEFGVYPIAIEALGRTNLSPSGGTAMSRIGWLASTVQAQPATKAYEQQGVTWVLPITGLPGTTEFTGTPDQVLAHFAHEVGPGSRLRNLLDASAGPGVVWAVDPQLLIALQAALTNPPKVAPPSAPATGSPVAPASSDRAVITNFLAELKAEARNHEILALPYADPDPSVLAASPASELWDSALTTGANVINTLLGVNSSTEVAWPASGSASDLTLARLATQGFDTIILDELSRPLIDPLNFTPDARSTALPQAFTGLFSDHNLSELAADTRRSNLREYSRFLAETAAVTTERPGLIRKMLIAIPRNITTDPVALKNLIATSQRVPWLKPLSFAQLVAPSINSGDSAALPRIPKPPTTPTSLSQGNLNEVLGLHQKLTSLDEVLPSSPGITAQLKQQTLDLISSGWGEFTPAWAKAKSRQETTINTFANQVTVLPTNITFLRRSGELRLTVINSFDIKVTGIRLQVQSNDPQLAVTTQISKPFALEPNTRTSILVPVKALATAEVELQAQLISPTSQVIGTPKEVRVRVRPTDSWVITGAGVLASLALLVGIARTIRKQRRPLSAEAGATT